MNTKSKNAFIVVKKDTTSPDDRYYFPNRPHFYTNEEQALKDAKRWMIDVILKNVTTDKLNNTDTEYHVFELKKIESPITTDPIEVV